MDRLLYLLLLAGLTLGARLAPAHDSPEHVVEDLTRAMERQGASAELLYRRACEYRVLGRLEKCAEDLHAALRSDPAHLPARLELGRQQLAQQQLDAALQTCQKAHASATGQAKRAQVHMLRGKVHLAAGQNKQALAECRTACQLMPTEIDWQLQYSRLLWDLGRHTARLAALEEACRANPSVVLKIERIEAELDAGSSPETLAEIEHHLANTRWRSSWLIRRARARQQQDQGTAARADLRAAIAEITQRLSPSRPDPSLLVDRGFAHALLGNFHAARIDLSTARTLQADPWSLRRLAALCQAEVSSN